MKSWEYRLVPLEKRILDRIAIDTSGCHIFQGTLDGSGYGQVKNHGVGVRVHRWVFEHIHGPIPAGRQVLHRCDNPACANIDHLFLGTHAINMADKAAKGRSKNVPRGFAHKRPMAKITEAQAREIKKLLARGYRGCDIAKDFGVSRNLISEIKVGKTWMHLDDTH